jgi:hypothetical protein
MAHAGMTHVDRHLWARMQRLDESLLTATLGTWLSPREIQAEPGAGELHSRLTVRGEMCNTSPISSW